VQYLLTGSALLQLAMRDNNPMKAWLADKPMQSYRMSVIGIGMARSAIDARSTGLLHKKWHEALDQRVNTLKGEGGRAIAIDEGIIDKWMLVRRMDLTKQGKDGPEQIGQDMRLDIAVALALGLTLVEPVQPYHAQLKAAGMDKIESIV
jgi:hypothetical protein